MTGLEKKTAGRAVVAVAAAATEWFSAAELAELALPGLPGDRRSLQRRARDERWASRSDAAGQPLCRPRAGKGGGNEFHISLLPGPAQIALTARGIAAAEAATSDNSAAAGSWRWFEGLTGKARDEAARRALALDEVRLLEAARLTRTAAIGEAAARARVSTATVWAWLGLVSGTPRSDWLPALAPRHRGGGAEAEIDADLWRIFESDFLSASAPTLAACYARTAAIAAARGLVLPTEATMRRQVKRRVHPSVITLRRQGEEALRRSISSQRRTVEQLHAMECVNIDGHKFDVFVVPPGGGKPIRPVLVALHDIRSSKFVAWRLAETENAVSVRLVFADLFENVGIPVHCVLDNGRGFASKWITGGAKTRFRFKIKDEEPTGVLTGLGVAIHWALPYRGQSKPIERAFRDLCDTIARHPAVAGAYTGNTVLAKPENYGSRAIPWLEFCAHVDRGIAAHNARLGRTGRDYRGRSFDQVFAESYAAAAITRATPEQLRMTLLAAEQKSVDRRTGEIALFGNRYWSPGCANLHGQKVTVRFDPDNLHRDVHLYTPAGRYLGSAAVIADTGFLDAAGAKIAARRWSDYKKLVRAATDAHQLYSAAQVAERQADAPDFEPPEPGVVRLAHHRLTKGGGQAALKPARQEIADHNHEREAREAQVFSILGRRVEE